MNSRSILGLQDYMTINFSCQPPLYVTDHHFNVAVTLGPETLLTVVEND